MSDYSREKFEALWESLHRDAVESKEPNESSVRLAEFYARLDKNERGNIDQILSDWIVGEDYGRRFDALALVNKFRIRSCLEAVHERLHHLEGATGPSVPYDRAKLKRTINRLDEG